jgi:acetyl-CoA carboxylase biotin carboxylase subunit
MFEKILIANRGEIALRVVRACRELGIKTVAVYSEVDDQSLHVQLADEAICIGAAASADSYLRADRIFSAAEITNVDAIHPGYGFLAENATFAEQCIDCDITFIGPSPKTIAQMGNKSVAKNVAKSVRVPCVPGSDRVIDNELEAKQLADSIGYPVIIKAAAGGGGKGMRLVNNSVSFCKEYKMARSEAEKAFGDGSVYIEKFIEDPHHIEFQILADKYGNVIHLFDRDCSIQRRYQKLVEEAPSPFLSEKLRSAMGHAAIKIAKKCEYQNAGTVEFLVDRHGHYYFIEMNARLQVEHGITEQITGFDIVKWQLLLAAGEKLPFSQKDVKICGHAIECRINAEDPLKNFAPCPGEISLYYSPGGNGIRVDSHVYAGYKIPPNYDSMIAKLVAFGKSREIAIGKMHSALSEYLVRGVKTTISFLRAIMLDKGYIAGNYTTKFVEDFLERTPVDALNFKNC